MTLFAVNLPFLPPCIYFIFIVNNTHLPFFSTFINRALSRLGTYTVLSSVLHRSKVPTSRAETTTGDLFASFAHVYLENRTFLLIGPRQRANGLANAVVVNMAAAGDSKPKNRVDTERRLSLIALCFFRFVTMMSTSSFFIILALLPLHARCATSPVASNLNPANLDGLKSQFQAALKSASDVASLHYTIAGNKELGVQSPDSLCSDIKRLTEKSNIESIYHASEAAKALANCKVTPRVLPRNFLSTVDLPFSCPPTITVRRSPRPSNRTRARQPKSTMPFVRASTSVSPSTRQ